MKNKTLSFKIVDIIYILMMILPLLCGMIIKILTKPLSNGIEISGAQIYFTIPMPIQDLLITESQVNSLFVTITILGLCLFLTHGLKTKNIRRRQLLTEWIIEKAETLVKENMGEYFSLFAPFIISIISISAFSSLLALCGLFPPTSDINIVAGWAILVFIIITYYKLKCGVLSYLKGFTEPIFVMAPLNVLGEIATPVSMAFRHYGNVLSGTVISVLVAAALQGLSSMVFGWLPDPVGKIPFLQIGIPAVLSVYFDIFSGLMQAYIFAMLTMLNISGAFSLEDYEKRKQKKHLKKQNKN